MTMLKRIRGSNFLQLVSFMLVAGAVCLHFRFEVLWDWANYHFYNPWAFFNDRWGYDILPAGVNTFFNPLLDIPLYLMVKFWNNYPDVIIFVQGFWGGAAAFVFFKIIQLFFDANTWKGRSQILLAFAVGVTSWPFFMQLGTSTNEMATSFFVLSAWLLIFRELKNEPQGHMRGKVFLLAGLLLGAAAGLKLTAVTYCISSGAALLLCCRCFKPFPKIIGLFILGGLAGFLITNGFWMLRLYESFGNPFFPLFNNIFESEYFDHRSFRDTSYLPTDIWGYVFHPFYVAALKYKLEGSLIIADYRVLFLYLLMFFLAGRGLYSFWRKRTINGEISPLNKYLWFLCACSYFSWLVLFGIFRYFIPVSLLSGIILVQAAFAFFPGTGNLRQSFYLSLMIVLSYVLLSAPHYSDSWDQRISLNPLMSFYTDVWPELKHDAAFVDKYGDFTKFVEMEDIALPENTRLQMYEMPTGGSLPLLNEHSDVRGVLMQTSGFNQEGDMLYLEKWKELRKNAIKGENAAMLISLEIHKIKYINYYRKFAEKNNLECHWLINNIMPWVLCVPADRVKSVFRWRYQ